MPKIRRVPMELIETYRSGTLDECVARYQADKTMFPYHVGSFLRSLIAVKLIYGDSQRYDILNEGTVRNRHADKSLLELYDSLPVDQCIQLYHMQHDNVDYKTRYALRVMIATKYIYGDAYVSIKGQQ